MYKRQENAQAAGFDGVEVHGANGYLLDEFLRDGANKRVGPYGGSFENRARLMFEVSEAVSGVWGSDRVGLRISPLNSYNSMIDSDQMCIRDSYTPEEVVAQLIASFAELECWWETKHEGPHVNIWRSHDG